MKKNNKAYIYYLLLGIGIGLVLGSIINFVNPNVEYREYSEEEIKEKARGLGMYDLDEIFEMNDKFNAKMEENLKNQSLNQESSDKTNKNSETKVEEKEKTEDGVKNNTDNAKTHLTAIDNPEKSDVETEVKNDVESSETEIEAKNDTEDAETVEYIEFDVEKGDSSETIIDNLLKADIITDKEKFVKAVVKRQAGRKFHYGNFKIPKGIDDDTLIDILTK